MHKSLSVTVQIGIPQAFCTNNIPCQTPLMVHDDINFTTRVSSEICTNKSADFPQIFRKHKSLCGKVKKMRTSRTRWTYSTNSINHKELMICAEDQNTMDLVDILCSYCTNSILVHFFIKVL